MSKERLEDIKKKYNYERLGEFIDAKPVNPYELKWLIQQAERVELLERENKALNDMLTTLEKQDITKLLNQNVRLIKENKRYREALEFYADEKSWMNRKVTILMDGEPTDVEDCPAIFDDGGNIARKALEEEE